MSSIIIIAILIVGTSLAFLYAFYPEIVLGWYEGQKKSGKMLLPKRVNLIMFRIIGTIIFVVFLGVLILAIMSLFIP